MTDSRFKFHKFWLKNHIKNKTKLSQFFGEWLWLNWYDIYAHDGFKNNNLYLETKALIIGVMKNWKTELILECDIIQSFNLFISVRLECPITIQKLVIHMKRFKYTRYLWTTFIVNFLSSIGLGNKWIISRYY